MKKKSGQKKKVAVDSDEEDCSRNTKSGQKKKEAEPSCPNIGRQQRGPRNPIDYGEGDII